MCKSKTTENYYEALPTSLKPFHYDLDVYDINVQNDTFKGKVTIFLNINEETDELYLNYRELGVTKDNIEASLISNNTKHVLEIKTLVENKAKEYFIIKFEEKLIPSQNTTLKVTIVYDAKIQTNMLGFYKSGYTDNGVDKFMYSTQFEATDARRAFPNLDEPALKSTFSVTIVTNKNWDVLGNMPVSSSEIINDNLKKVSFEKTPLMSTYLLAWACGEFEYIESFTEDLYQGKPLPVRIYTTKGYIEQAKFALEITPKIVDYYSRTFEIQYPLPKLDLIAVHAYSHNAMENWGLITYRSTALLYSETKSDPSYKKKVAYVIGHELAHQWFGDLVTMKWWDELWLNEGFATWVGYEAVDYLFPEWDIFNVFVSESLEKALELDGLRNSHPIEIPINDALDIDQVFDHISYLKGASIILMISNYLGDKTFLKGVAKYLNQNKYGNATSDDLWAAISESSGKPVGEMMNNWIKKIGFPVVDVEINEQKQLAIKQSRFLNGGDATEEEDQTLWWIPLNIAGDFKLLNKMSIDSFDSKSLVIDDFQLADTFFKFNRNSSGVFRVNYSENILKNNILPYFDRLSVGDKVGLIADISYLSMAGYASTSTFLNFVKYVVQADKLGTDFVVWAELTERLSLLSMVFSGVNEKLTNSLANFCKEVYSKVAIESLNELKSNKQSSDFLKIKLRSLVLEKAGLLEIPEVYDYALELFEKWKGGSSVDPSLRSFVFTTIAGSSSFNESQFELILREVTNPSSLDSREIALAALGHVQDIKIAKTIINYLINPDIIPLMDAHFIGEPLSANSKTRDEFWVFFSKNYDALYKFMSQTMFIYDRFIRLTLSNFQSLEMHDKITKLFEDKDVHGFERSYMQSLDNIKINANWLTRDQSDVISWLEINNF